MKKEEFGGRTAAYKVRADLLFFLLVRPQGRFWLFTIVKFHLAYIIAAALPGGYIAFGEQLVESRLHGDYAHAEFGSKRALRGQFFAGF